jgi:hypothetical protein
MGVTAMIVLTLLLAQVVQISGGASTLLNADGATASVYTPNSTSQVSAGLSDGRLVAGASTHFDFHSYDVRFGDSQLFLQSGNEGTVVNLRGVDVRRGPLELFTGAVGKAYSAPFFNGTTAADLGYGLRFSWPLLGHRETGPPPAGYLGPEHHLPDVKLTTVLVHAGSKTTTLAELGARWGPLNLAVAGGIVENRSLFNGRADLRWKHFGANATRVTYFVPLRIDATSEGIGVQAGPFDAYASAFQSKGASGEAVGGGLRISWVSIRANEFWSRQEHAYTTNLAEQVTRHLSLAQFYTRSNGSNAWNLGGGWHGNLVSFDLGWQTYFQPGRGFRTLSAATVSLQLPHSINVNLSLVGSRWTTYGGIYVAGFATGAPTATWKKPKLLDYQP